MGFEHYHLAPVILSDALFFAYVPTCHNTGTFTQRRAAYIMAEQQMMDELGTFLVPTIITGSMMWPDFPRPLLVPYDRIQAIPRVVVTAFKGDDTLETYENAGQGIIRDGRGVIDALVTGYHYSHHAHDSMGGFMYQAIVTIQAGLPTGVSAVDTGLHMGLALAAEVALNEIVDPGSNEGGPGDPGVKQWGSLGYSETRQDLRRTAFGQTAKANYIQRLISHLKRVRSASVRF